MFREYIKALFKRADSRQLSQFRPPTLPPRIYTKYINVDSTHYQKFCHETQWHSDDHMHPLYLQVLSLPLQMQCLLDKKSPFPLLGLIHYANKVQVHGNCNITDVFECRVKFSDVRPHSRGWEFDVSLFAFQHGQCVYEAISTYLLKAKAVHVAPKPIPAQTNDSCFEESQCEIGTLDVSTDIGRRYAKLSGDYNPIHLYPFTAKAFGFKQPIAHGMWTLARTISVVMQNEDKVLSQVDCYFKRPIYLPSKVQLITYCETENACNVDVVDEEQAYTHLNAQLTF